MFLLCLVSSCLCVLVVNYFVLFVPFCGYFLEPIEVPRRESSKIYREDSVMTRKRKFILTSIVTSIALGLSALAGLALAQEAVPQEPPTPPEVAEAPQAFSYFFDGGTFLGVYPEDITRENMARYGLHEVHGVGVTGVVKGSPAEKAGLKKDDVIVRFDGEPVTSVRKLNRLVNEAAPDQTVKITISRGGSEQELAVTLAKHQEFEREWEMNLPRGHIFRNGGSERGEDIFVFPLGANRRIGVSTQSLTRQLADYFGAKDGGVLITSVSENSAAAKAGLKAGDVITAIDGEKVESSGDVSRAINKKQDGEVTLTILRDKATRTIKVTPEKSQGPLVWPGRTIAGRRIVIPPVDLGEFPGMNIQLPTIEIPRIALPKIDINIPRPLIRVTRRAI